MTQQPDRSGPAVVLALLVLVGLLVVAWGVGHPVAVGARTAPSVVDSPAAPPSVSEPDQTPARSDRRVPRGPVELPGGGTRVFGGHRFLVAYYGSAGSGALGVLGETDPDTADARLRRAARPFGGPHRPLRRVYELIVTVADGSAGRDGDYSHDIARADVARYLAAAHRNHALLLLDVQPGRSDFLDVARRWAWALRDPWVGLALDPEWRMGPHQVPAQTVGQVSAREINRTSAWLSALTRRHHLPQKLLVLHQFRADMVRHAGDVVRRPGLAMVQHVDGFGTPREKRATYHAVARPGTFTMGFKLFYDEDVHRMGPAAVRSLRPRVRFVSFQ